jgi:hypothetical protein
MKGGWKNINREKEQLWFIGKFEAKEHKYHDEKKQQQNTSK